MPLPPARCPHLLSLNIPLATATSPFTIRQPHSSLIATTLPLHTATTCNSKHPLHSWPQVTFLLPADHGLDPSSTLVILQDVRGTTTPDNPLLEQALSALGLNPSAPTYNKGDCQFASCGRDDGSRSLAILSAPAPLSAFAARPIAPRSPLLMSPSGCTLPEAAEASWSAALHSISKLNSEQQEVAAAPTGGCRRVVSRAEGEPLLIERLTEFGDRYEAVLSAPSGGAASGEASGRLSGLSVRAASPPPRHCCSSHEVVVRVGCPAPGFLARLRLLCPVLVDLAGEGGFGGVVQLGRI